MEVFQDIYIDLYNGNTEKLDVMYNCVEVIGLFQMM